MQGRPTDIGFGNRVVRHKALVFGGLLLVLGLAVFASNSRMAQVAWHKWRLVAAIESARTAGAGKPTPGQEFVAIVRGAPLSSEECIAAWQRHEDALVQLCYLSRREFPWRRRASTPERMRICAAAEKAFARPQLWSVTRSPSNEYAVLVTALGQDMARWEDLIRRLQEEERFARKSPVEPPRRFSL
jgi:hypothetical protein